MCLLLQIRSRVPKASESMNFTDILRKALMTGRAWLPQWLGKIKLIMAPGSLDGFSF